jgi:hypothetical protein
MDAGGISPVNLGTLCQGEEEEQEQRGGRERRQDKRKKEKKENRSKRTRQQKDNAIKGQKKDRTEQEEEKTQDKDRVLRTNDCKIKVQVINTVYKSNIEFINAKVTPYYCYCY